MSPGANEQHGIVIRAPLASPIEGEPYGASWQAPFQRVIHVGQSTDKNAEFVEPRDNSLGVDTARVAERNQHSFRLRASGTVVNSSGSHLTVLSQKFFGYLDGAGRMLVIVLELRLLALFEMGMVSTP
jgi:hypothetical protein